MEIQRPTRLNDVEACVDAIIARVGKNIVLGMPLGMGKPNHLANALFLRAKRDPTLNLRILTALSLGVPKAGSDLEKKFLGPFVERVWGDYPSLAYLEALTTKSLPPNVQVSEFFMKAGVFLDNLNEQQNYISSNYTHIARDMLANGVNCVAQMVAQKVIGGETFLSLSCNPDVTPTLIEGMRELEKKGHATLVVAQVNNNLPFMVHDAMVSPSMFDIIVENPSYEHKLFSTPNMPVEMADYMIGMNVSTLIKDGGTLQIGIGSLGDAIAYSVIQREKANEQYRAAVEELGILAKSGALVSEIGGTGRFEKGLYGASEMFVNGFLELYKAGILRRKVYGDVVLQRLLNQGRITEQVTVATLEALVAAQAVHAQLTEADVATLKKHGVFRAGVRWEGGQLLTEAGLKLSADLTRDAALAEIARHCLGDRLKDGVLMHGAFFLGPNSFYETLRAMSDEERELFGMTTVDNVNHLYGDQALKAAQRKDGRFVNTCLMVTLSGGIISDGLEDARVVSGVGGQYNFVSMAHALPDGRLIMMLRSHRTKDGAPQSNVVWNYGHMTIPRILRDIVVTEYGIADLRSRSDKEVMAALLNVTDSRFQGELLAKAKAAGKMPADYEIPEAHRHNLPEVLAAKFKTMRAGGLFPAFPFGNDFTREEMILSSVLKGLKAKMAQKMGAMAGGIFSVIRGSAIPEKALPYLRRMQLDKPASFKEKVVQSLLVEQLIEGGHV